MDPKKRYYEDSGVALWAIGIFLCVWSAWASGYTALWGGKSAGLSQDAWNWQDIPFMLGGWIGGFIVSLGLLVFVRKTSPVCLGFTDPVTRLRHRADWSGD